MLLGQWLHKNTTRLKQAGLTTARLDCLILAEDVLRKDRSHLLAHPELPIQVEHLAILNKLIVQREKHTPLAYIRGKAAFYGRYFWVDKSVLVPRPETEIMIEMLKKISFNMPVVRIADVGTGSGCIGITAALEIASSVTDFYDIDGQALAIAHKNAAIHSVTGHFYKSNLLSDFHGPYDIVLTNLPYVPEKYPINTAAHFEPDIALFSGEDGLDHYRLLWQQIAGLKGTNKPQHVLTEAFPNQHTLLAKIALAAGYKQQKSEGFIQHFALPAV